MDLKLSSDEDEIFLFERVVKHLQLSYGYSSDGAVRLVNEYHAKFTKQNFCDRYDMTTQAMDFFWSH